MWRSSVKYGETNNYYDTRKKSDPVYRMGDAPPWRVYIPGRVITKDFDGDGLKEVIISRNQRLAGLFDKVRNFGNGEIHSLIWQNGFLDTHWKTRQINGYVTDFQIRDVDNDGEEELVVSVVNLGDITDRKVTSNILFFKLF